MREIDYGKLKSLYFFIKSFSSPNLMNNDILEVNCNGRVILSQSLDTFRKEMIEEYGYSIYSIEFDKNKDVLVLTFWRF